MVDSKFSTVETLIVKINILEAFNLNYNFKAGS